MTDAREQQLLAEIGRLHMVLLQQTSTPEVPPEGPATTEPLPGGRRPERVTPKGRS